ncbi:DUF192 domain-containing protein [Sanguibacter suarezii]|uniref:DUF192 domain-containing protein n=1 Tax=Sanguibacter suarezii TaxID=60921 RepID=UPI00082F89C4|nr:DUF192 domain-containing protein [Sanguibacter suarezii]
MRRAPGVAAGLAAVALAGCATTVEQATMTFQGGGAITVEVAVSPDQRRLGLSGRTDVAQGTGMVFGFGAQDVPQLWMVDTLVPLDALWIRDGRIIQIDHMSPCWESNDEDCQIWAPALQVDAVVEMPPGHGRVVGEVVRW